MDYNFKQFNSHVQRCHLFAQTFRVDPYVASPLWSELNLNSCKHTSIHFLSTVRLSMEIVIQILWIRKKIGLFIWIRKKVGLNIWIRIFFQLNETLNYLCSNKPCQTCTCHKLQHFCSAILFRRESPMRVWYTVTATWHYAIHSSMMDLFQLNLHLNPFIYSYNSVSEPQ